MTHELPPAPIALLARFHRAEAKWTRLCDVNHRCSQTVVHEERRRQAYQELKAAAEEMASGWHQYPYRADTCRRCFCRGYRRQEYGWLNFCLGDAEAGPEEPFGLVPLWNWYPRSGGAYPVCIPCAQAMKRTGRPAVAEPGDGDLPEYKVAPRQLDLFA